jgi:hypothetical protein
MKYLIGILLCCTALCSFAQNVPAPTTTVEQKQKEIDLLEETFRTIHTGTFRYNSPAQIEQYFAELRRKCSQNISDREYFLLLSQFAEKIKCGHTYLNPWNQKEDVKAQYFSQSHFPFLYRIVDKKWIITHNLSEFPTIRPGDEIVRINGISCQRAMDSLLTVSRTDGRNGLGKKMDNLNLVPIDIDTANYSLFDIYFPLFFPNTSFPNHFEVEIKPYKGKTRHYIASALPKAKRQEIFVERFGEIPIHEKNWEFKFLNPATAYLRLGDFETWEWEADYKVYLDSVFNLLHQSKAQNLIVDLRGNEGGDDEARTEVLSYLVEQPFGCENPMIRKIKFLSISDSLLPYLKTWSKEAKAPRNPDDYRRTEDGYYVSKAEEATPCVLTQPKPQVFQGQKYLLINSNNSSTSFTLAHIFKQTHTGLLIGEPTGGTQQGLNGGQFFFLRLPHSHIEMDIPFIWGAPTQSKPDEGITPDHIVPTNQKDIARGVDTQLAFTLKLIGDK